MPAVTVRNFPEKTHRAIKLRAARNGRSTEAEIRKILEDAVSSKTESGTRLAVSGAWGGALAELSSESPAIQSPLSRRISRDRSRHECHLGTAEAAGRCGRVRAALVARSSAERNRSICARPVLMEVLLGIALLPAGKRKRGMASAMQSLLANYFADRFLAFDREAAMRHDASLASRAAARGYILSVADCQIAAIAAVHENLRRTVTRYMTALRISRGTSQRRVPADCWTWSAFETRGTQFGSEFLADLLIPNLLTC